MIYLYLTQLIIAPQLWVKPFIGLATDTYLYPLWLASFLVTGKICGLIRYTKTNLVFVGMIFWLILSVLVNPKNSHTVKVVVDYLKFFVIVQFVVASITDFRNFKRVIFFLLFLIFMLAFESIDHKTATDGLGWAGQTLGWADEEILRTSGSGRTQWINIFDGPGVFCVLFTIAFPFVLQHLDKHYSMLVKFFSLAGVTILSIAIYYTGSRGGFLATLVCVFAYTLSRSNLSIRRLIFSSIVAFSLFLAAPAFLTSTSDSHGSAQNRVDVWKEGLEMVRYNPVFGIGRGNYASYTGSLIAHNSAIEMMGETGLPGFFFWISLITLSFKNIRSFFLSTDNLNEKSYAIALAISIVGYLASSMFVTLEYETFYFLLGLAAALGKLSGSEATYTLKDAGLVFGLIIGWLVLLKVFFMLY